MAVTIKYERVMVRGERKVRIHKVHALKEEQLPVQYTEDKRAFWMSQNERYLYFKNNLFLEEDSTISKEQFEKFVAKIFTGGELLKKINEELAEVAEKWKGKKVLDI